MHTLRRRSLRRHYCRAATIRFEGNAVARDGLVINVSKGGARLDVED
jgi:hypothetical protein